MFFAARIHREEIKLIPKIFNFFIIG